jgi:hypothetical protein
LGTPWERMHWENRMSSDWRDCADELGAEEPEGATVVAVVPVVLAAPVAAWPFGPPPHAPTRSASAAMPKTAPPALNFAARSRDFVR